MYAFISDIHANLEALCAVMKDIDQHPVEKIICLGDIVGYGADPEPCTDIIMEKTEQTIMGNHDYALTHGPDNFNPYAADIIIKTAKKMNPNNKNAVKEPESDIFEPDFYRCNHKNTNKKCTLLRHSETYRWDFLSSLPLTLENEDYSIVHGSPLDPISDYVYPNIIEGLWNPDKIGAIFTRFKNLLFCGHTHFPCAIDSDFNCYYPKECHYKLTLNTEKKYIINTGSVGQPRDRDNRSSYILFDIDTNTITWRRIPYDIKTTMQKISIMCGTDNWCSQRLELGR